MRMFINSHKKTWAAIKTSALGLCALTFSLAVSSATENYAITGAQIHTMSNQGTIESGTVLIADGKIKQIVKGVSVPAGFTEIDAKGKVITPGFIGALTNLGLVEVSMSAGVNDARVKSHPVSSVGAAFDAKYAINNDSTLIDITRLEGFTSAVSGISSTGQLFDGQGLVITLDNSFDMIIRPHAFMHIDLGDGGANGSGESRAALWVALNQSLDEASFAANYDLNPSQDWNGMISRADALALAKVINGNMPLLVTANRASDILQVLALKQRYKDINLVLVSVSDGWRVAKQIAEAKVPVILNPESNLPGQFDQLGATLENAARLNAANVMIAIGINTHNVRLASQHAGNAVANGLPHSAALAALTINPATIFGVAEQIGSLENGKQADLVIWSGDPLEVTQAAEQVFIKGVSMPMESRQTKLRDRYLHRDTAWPASYTK